MKAALNSLLALALLALASALPAEVQHTLQNLERDLDDINYAVVSHEQIHDLEKRAAKHCRWWKPKNGNAGYCSMWDPTWYMHTANEITTPSDCNAPFAAIGNDMLEREE